jgi:hypothetical protein
MSFLTEVRSHVLARENEPINTTSLLTRHVPTWCAAHGHSPVRYEGMWRCANCADLYSRS